MTGSRTPLLALLVLAIALLLPVSAMAQLSTDASAGPGSPAAFGVVAAADTARDKSTLATASHVVAVADTARDKSLLSASSPSQPSVTAAPSNDVGFAWGDAGVGLVGGLGIGVLLAAITLVAVRRPHRPMAT